MMTPRAFSKALFCLLLLLPCKCDPRRKTDAPNANRRGTLLWKLEPDKKSLTPSGTYCDHFATSHADDSVIRKNLHATNDRDVVAANASNAMEKQHGLKILRKPWRRRVRIKESLKKGRTAILRGSKRAFQVSRNRWSALRLKRKSMIQGMQQRVLEGAFASQIMKQRCGLVRTLRSTRNAAGIVLGAWMAFASCIELLPPEPGFRSTNELSLAVQGGMQAWMVINHCLARETLPDDKGLDSSPTAGRRVVQDNQTTKNANDIKIIESDGKENDLHCRKRYVMSAERKEEHSVVVQPRPLRSIFQNVMFKDFIAIVVALWTLRIFEVRRNHFSTSLLRNVIPMIGVFRVTFRSVESIVDDMLLQENLRKRGLYRILLRNRRSGGLQISKRQKHLIGSGMGMLLLAIIHWVPIRVSLVPLIAASLMGITLMADSILDEIINNWLNLLLQKMGPENRKIVLQYLYDYVQESLRCHVLYPIRELFEEMEFVWKDVLRSRADLVRIDGSLKSNVMEELSIRNEKNTSIGLVRERVKDAVLSSYQLQIFWIAASLGVFVQLFGLYRQPIASIVKEGLSMIPR